MSKKKLLYIVNPISGNGKKANIICDIEKYTDTNTFDFEIKKTEYAGHAAEIAKAAAEIGIEAIVAVGGDGTINEVARSIVCARHYSLWLRKRTCSPSANSDELR